MSYNSRFIYVYIRYRRNKKDRSTKQQNGEKTRKFDNDAFTNDYSNTGKFIFDSETDSR